MTVHEYTFAQGLGNWWWWCTYGGAPTQVHVNMSVRRGVVDAPASLRTPAAHAGDTNRLATALRLGRAYAPHYRRDLTNVASSFTNRCAVASIGAPNEGPSDANTRAHLAMLIVDGKIDILRQIVDKTVEDWTSPAPAGDGGASGSGTTSTRAVNDNDKFATCVGWQIIAQDIRKRGQRNDNTVQELFQYLAERFAAIMYTTEEARQRVLLKAGGEDWVDVFMRVCRSSPSMRDQPFNTMPDVPLEDLPPPPLPPRPPTHTRRNDELGPRSLGF